MIHAASLLHDDVIDEAGTRRGVSSLNALFGNKLAILGGWLRSWLGEVELDSVSIAIFCRRLSIS